MAKWYVPPDDREGFVLPRVIVPGLCEVQLENPHFTPRGRALAEMRARGPIAGGASLSAYTSKKVLDLLCNASAYATPTSYLGLWTSALADDSTSATAGELTYT